MKVCTVCSKPLEVNQRAWAKHLGVFNFCFQVLVKKGFLKIHNFSHGKSKLHMAIC